jgi:hypothetical protein
MPQVEFSSRLRGEIREHQNKRHQFSLRKLTFVTALLGVGSLSVVSGKDSRFDTSFLLYLVPFVAIAFDLYIVSEDYRVKRAGAFLAKQESGAGDMERAWETFVKNNVNRWACYAFAIVTGVVIASSMMVLWVTRPSERILAILVGALTLLAESSILIVSLRMRGALADRQ